MWVTLIVWCWLSLFSVVPCSSIDFTFESRDCFNYTLVDNECSIVLAGKKNVSIKESEQQDFFDQNVSLTVSNVRMVEASCRRPFLSYYCQLVFGSFSCEASSEEEGLCLERESCLLVSEACLNFFEMDCSLSSPSPSPSPSLNNCQEEVENQFNQIVKTPIAVETCLNGSKETIDCCLDLYIFDDNDECVVQCYQYLYGEKLENSIRIVIFVVISLAAFGYLVAVIPLSLMTNLRYPNNVPFIFLGSFIVSYYFLSWSTFVGGAVPYFCRGKKNYWTALQHFGTSNRSLIQFSVWVFLIHFGFSHWLLFSFNLFCNSMRPHTNYFEKFILQPVRPSIVYLMEGTCLFLSLATPLGIIFAVNNLPSSKQFSPLPVYIFPSNQGVDPLVTNLFQLPVLIYGGISAILYSVAVFFFVKRGRAIVYFQWRTLLFGFFGVTVFVLSFVFLLSLRHISDAPIIEHAECVASHPQTISPPCQRQSYPSIDFLFFNLSTSLLLLVINVILYWTNSIVSRWWKEFFCSRRVLTSVSTSEYELLN